MKDVIDIHTHSLASGHAYSTIHEMANAAIKNGIEILGITEHGPNMLGSCKEFYFKSLRFIERDAFPPLKLMLGAELNIMDFKGSVDLSQAIMETLDILIASLHPKCITAGNMEENTAAYINTMKTCGVNVIGHPDDGNYPVDYKKLANVAADMNVILEVNNASFIPTTYRINTESNCKEMLKWCKEYGTNVIISSDAHFETLVGRHDLAVKLLEDIEFPQELVLNSDPENFFAILKKRKKA